MAVTRYQYKEQYEQFKLIVNLLGGVLAIASYFFNILVGGSRRKTGNKFRRTQT